MGLILATLEAKYKGGLLMQETKEKKVRLSKKDLLREIAENTNGIDIGSIERTNIKNLVWIRDKAIEENK